MSPVSWGDIFTLPLRGDRIMELRQWTDTVWPQPGTCVSLRVRLGQEVGARAYQSGRSAAWLARLVRDQEVDGSNPFAPTTSIPLNQQLSYALVCEALPI